MHSKAPLVLLLVLLAAGGLWIAGGRSPRAVASTDSASALERAVEPSPGELPFAGDGSALLRDTSLVGAVSPPAASERAPVATEDAHAPFIVDVTTTSGPEASAAPHVAFDIRLRSALRGSPAVYSGVTDARGMARVELRGDDVPRTIAGKPRSMLGAVTQQGYLHDSVRVNAPWRPGVNFSLELTATPGVTLRGRVLGPSGHGASADLKFWEPSGVAPAPAWVSTGTGHTHTDGNFEMHLQTRGRGTLLASKSGVGTGALHYLDLRAGAPIDDMLIVLQGDGSLIGRVRDVLGAPAAGLPLQIQFAAGQPSEHTAGPGSDPWTEGLGATVATCVTNGAGEFALRGLRPGPYHVRARPPGEASGYSLRVTEQPLLANGTSHLLVLTRPHLIVQVTDAQGQPIATSAMQTGLGFERVQGVSRFSTSSWPGKVHILVVPCEASPNGPRASGEAIPGWRASALEFGFDLQEGRSYLVGALGPGFDGSMREVHAPPGSGRIPVALAARVMEDVLGSVRVNVIAGSEPLESDSMFDFSIALGRRGPDDGDPDLVAAIEGRYSLTLRRSDTDTAVMKRPCWSSVRWTFEVPPGRYRVVAEANDDWPYREDDPLRLHGEVSADVQITAGLQQSVELAFEP